MQLLLSIYLFIIGACFGSFAGAMAWRIEKGKDVLKDRSECEKCHHKLSALDLVPIVSWLWLRGKCRYCQHPIGSDAILLELSMGALFVVSFLAWPYGFMNVPSIAQFVLWLVSLVLLAILFVYDRRHFLLPDVLVWPLAGIGLSVFILHGLTQQSTPLDLIRDGLLALVPITGVYGALYVISHGKWIGLGDVKLGLFIGLVLGWQSAIVALVLANLIGTLIILPGLATGKLQRDTHIPFGPFLITATILVFFWGHDVVSWYQRLLLS